jgi:DNA sulfur modification protein DndE
MENKKWITTVWASKKAWALWIFLLTSTTLSGTDKVTIYLIGDSTMSIKQTKAYPETGWGMPFTYFFDSTVVVDNRAKNGRSSRTFIEENLWKPVVDSLQAGDYVLIQFGHNDEVKTKKSYTTTSEFKSYLQKYVTETKNKKATPILITPAARRHFDENGVLLNTHEPYSETVRAVAKENHIACIDLDAQSQALLKRMGPENSKLLFNYLEPNEHPNYPQGKQDNTHFNELGARKMAELVFESLNSLKLPLTQQTVKPGNITDWKLPIVTEPSFKTDTFNILQYGAVNDGITLNTKSILSAINDCNERGGGVVLIPNGLWLTGPIELKNNVNLHLSNNATLLFTKDKSQYELIASNWEGEPSARNQSPLWGTNLENIAITGKGIIDGNGDAWRSVKKEKLTETQWQKLISSGGVLSEDQRTWYPSLVFQKAAKLDKPGVLLNGKTLEDCREYKDFFRPNLLVFTSCKKILLEGPTFQNSAAWCLHPLMCENLTVRDVYVNNPWYAQNGDGIDVESCSNVLIENCVFDVGDDGICLKSGRDEEGRKRGMPTQNLIARNCAVYHAHGGIVIGSEMSGGVRNIYVENCTFIGTDIGLRFKTTRGRGGLVEDIFIRNISMRDIVGESILFDMYYLAKDPIPLIGEKKDVPKIQTFPVTEATPQFKNFQIENVVCNGAEKAIFIRGLPEMNINDIRFQNIVIQAKKGIEISEAQNISLRNTQILLSENVPVVSITNSTKLYFESLRFRPDTELIFNIKGVKSKEIKVLKTDASKAVNSAMFSEGAKLKSIEIK